MTNNKKICILSGRYPQSIFDSYINHKLYADRHGYTYIYCNWPTKEKNPYMNKIVYILEYVDYFDYIFWIDDDAFFIDFTIKLEKFFPKDNAFATFCKSPTHKKIFTYLSSGQFMLSCTDVGKAFLNDILKLDLIVVKKWWRDNLGMYTHGDQDKIVYLLHEVDNYKNKVNILGYKNFNSRIENLKGVDSHNVFILHLTGSSKIKNRSLKEAMSILGLPRYLVDNKSAIGYNFELSFWQKLKTKLMV